MRLVLALIAGFSLACSMSAGEGGEEGEGEDEEGKGPPVDPRTLVDVAAVAPGTVGDHVVASAAVESEAQAALVPETTGVVTGIYAEEGDDVRKGQLLAVIASPQLDAAYERATAELERATADAEAAERLFAQGAIARTELETAQRALAAARTAHQEASQTRGFTRLESPIDGVVAARGIRFGETAGPTPAYTIVDPGKLRVVVALPERDLARVRVGQPATVVSAYDEAVGASGEVVRVAPVVDTQTGTVRVTVALDPGQAVLRPGQYVSVRVEVARHEGVLTVPRRAVVWEEGQSYVYTLLEGPPPGEKPEEEQEEEEEEAGWSFNFGGDEEEEEEPEVPGPYRRAHRVRVKLGFEDGVNAEIVEGVAAGEQVVTVGNQALRDDARVRLPSDPVMAKAEEGKEPGRREGG
ncbi:MAG: efflux RND transporter periplasmic adaptor subunit [Deltaproteobacteria bacterium]|nr:efflux RND transporter periplasmic adaptor subunit [Deltaproteobacteria bacterium]